MLKRSYLGDVAKLCCSVWKAAGTGSIPRQLKEQLDDTIFESLVLLFEYNPLGPQVRMPSDSFGTTMTQAITLPPAIPSYVGMVWYTQVATRLIEQHPTGGPKSQGEHAVKTLRALRSKVQNDLFVLATRSLVDDAGTRSTLNTVELRRAWVRQTELSTSKALQQFNPVLLGRGSGNPEDAKLLSIYRDVLHLAGASFLYVCMEKHLCGLHQVFRSYIDQTEIAGWHNAVCEWLRLSCHKEHHPLVHLTYSELVHCLLIPPGAVLIRNNCPDWHTQQYSKLEKPWCRRYRLHREWRRAQCARVGNSLSTPGPKTPGPLTSPGSVPSLSHQKSPGSAEMFRQRVVGSLRDPQKAQASTGNVSARQSPIRAWGVQGRSPEQVLQQSLDDGALEQITALTKVKFSDLFARKDGEVDSKSRSRPPSFETVAYEAMCLSQLVYAFHCEFGVDLHGAGYIALPHQLHDIRTGVLECRAGVESRHPIMLRTYVEGWFVSHVLPPASHPHHPEAHAPHRLIHIPCTDVIGCFVTWLCVVQKDYGSMLRCRTKIDRWRVLFQTNRPGVGGRM